MSFFPYHDVARVTQCKYKRIGCPWQGPFHELPAHESECSHPTKTGTELMGILGEMDQNHRRDMQLYNSIFSLLCYEKIGFTGNYKRRRKYFSLAYPHLMLKKKSVELQLLYSCLLLYFLPLMLPLTASLPSNLLSYIFVHAEVQFRPYRTDDFITRLYYETPRFTVLNQTWVLKARVNDSERNPNLSCKRTLSFQLILKSKVHTLFCLSIFIFKGFERMLI